MRFTLGQELRQEQKQILTQRMIQSMEILQLSMLQLEERIDKELKENPVLELDMESANTTENANDEESFGENNSAETAEESETTFEYEPEIRFDSASDSEEEFQIADDFAQNYSDTIDELPARSQNWLEDQNERRNDVFANIPSPSQTLQDYLIEQLGWFDLSPPLRAMVERIINYLDPNGYFPFDFKDFLGADHTPEEQTLAAEALEIVRKLDPPGVGGRDLKDCLLLQIRPEMPNSDILRILILSHLEDISANRLPHIVRHTGFSLEAIQGAITELRHFNPRPGADFNTESSAVIIPDVIVEKNDEGRYVVRIEDGRRSQQLHVSGCYRELMKDRGTAKGTRDYIKQKVGSAQWLIEAIEQRRATLRKVSQAIVDHQIDFFEIGPHALKPLKMQQIADIVGIHITTVSRACDEKWMMTPQGVFPLKRFFSGALAASDGGEEVAHDTVRFKLREIIDKEDKREPLSDDALVKLLDDAGIRVARRTIVKYRQIMNIPSSRKRKIWNP
ncbi:MAG: RNA polymerase factor sigma-54 [Planctomycetaceae bacterium]|jgi:RNA polymerase sigma-54 factor|nr:RNA polymerase factor sigma-54 [Planctomycetaceae bacterium]